MTTDEVRVFEIMCVELVQQQAVRDPKFAEDKEQLRLKVNQSGVWECHGRIQGEYPIYLPDPALFTTKVVRRAHLSMFAWWCRNGCGKGMRIYWVQRLRKLTKKVISGCWGCKKFRALPANRPHLVYCRDAKPSSLRPSL